MKSQTICINIIQSQLNSVTKPTTKHLKISKSKMSDNLPASWKLKNTIISKIVPPFRQNFAWRCVLACCILDPNGCLNIQTLKNSRKNSRWQMVAILKTATIQFWWTFGTVNQIGPHNLTGYQKFGFSKFKMADSHHLENQNIYNRLLRLVKFFTSINSSKIQKLST